MTPRVSVLLPVRDGAETLSACLDSLAAQTLADHEVVAIDDGSGDDTASLLAARRDPRLRVLRTPPRGLVAALNLAAATARAPLFARMDADDVCDPDRLRLQAERLDAEPGLDVLGCGVRVPGARAGLEAYVAWQNALLTHEDIVRDLLVESPLVHPSVMMRAAALRRVGGYRDTGGPEDYDLWLRAEAAGLRFAKRPEILLTWSDRPGRLTRTDPRYAAARFRDAKLAALERLLVPARPVVVWGAGPLGKRFARGLLARGHAICAFVEVDPRKVGQRVHGAPVVGVDQVGALPPALHLAAVGQPGARARIRTEAERQGVGPVVAVA